MIHTYIIAEAVLFCKLNAKYTVLMRKAMNQIKRKKQNNNAHLKMNQIDLHQMLSICMFVCMYVFCIKYCCPIRKNERTNITSKYINIHIRMFTLTHKQTNIVQECFLTDNDVSPTYSPLFTTM